MAHVVNGIGTDMCGSTRRACRASACGHATSDPAVGTGKPRNVSRGVLSVAPEAYQTHASRERRGPRREEML